MSAHGNTPHGSRARHLMPALVTSLFVVGFLLPSIVYAAPKSFADLVWLIIDIINPLVGFLMTVALLFFFWNVILFIYSASGEGKGKYRENMTWGIIALFVLVSFFGIARILQNTLAGTSYNNPYPESGTRQPGP